jgi:hypothetical protein
MHEFQGDLLIGGMRLRQVHGELEEEQPKRGSREWKLSGHLHLSPEQLQLIEVNREYRIQLDDGRAAQIVISHLESENGDELLADFKPSQLRKPRAK